MAVKLHRSRSQYAQWADRVQLGAGLKAMGCLPPSIGSHRVTTPAQLEDLGLDDLETA